MVSGGSLCISVTSLRSNQRISRSTALQGRCIAIFTQAYQGQKRHTTAKAASDVALPISSRQLKAFKLTKFGQMSTRRGVQIKYAMATCVSSFLSGYAP